jgi:hypothetical protein
MLGRTCTNNKKTWIIKNNLLDAFTELHKLLYFLFTQLMFIFTNSIVV